MYRVTSADLLKRLWVLLAACGTLTPLLTAAEPADPWRYARERLEPFWRATTMYDESVLFIQDEVSSGTDTKPLPQASLLFVPKRILSVCSSSGEVRYEEGKDYAWKPGERIIRLPSGSRIVFQRPQDLRRVAGSQPYRLTHRDGNGEIMFGATHEYHDLQTVITYEHDGQQWQGPRPNLAATQLPATIARLKAGEPLTICLLGDSISTGCNASQWAGVAPFQPPYQELLVPHLKAAYGSDVQLHNCSVGGRDSAWGLTVIDQVLEERPHLVILAFGMNDAAGRPADEFQRNMKAMIDAVRAKLRTTEFILVAPMRGNRNWVTLQPELFPQYRDALAQLCGDGVALADLTSCWDAMLATKQDWDLTGNGVNHPNDFGHRVYAQVLSALLVE